MAKLMDARIVIVGEAGVGKSTLVWRLFNDDMDSEIPKIAPTVQFPPAVTGINHCNFFVYDTDSSDPVHVLDASKMADLSVVLYSSDNISTLERAVNFWIPELVKASPKTPIALVRTKCDLEIQEPKKAAELIKETADAYKQNIMYHLEVSNAEIKTYSAFLIRAISTVAYPLQFLIDMETLRAATPKFKAALRRIFTLLDESRSGYLSNQQLSTFHKIFFGEPLTEEDIHKVKAHIKQSIPHAVTTEGFTFSAFMFMQLDLIRRDQVRSIFNGLMKFGYTIHLDLTDDYLKTPQPEVDQAVELSQAGIDFVNGLFDFYCSTPTTGFSIADVKKVFTDVDIYTPWPVNYLQIVPSTNDYLSREDWVLLWKWAVQNDCGRTIRAFAHLGARAPGSFLSVTQSRKVDRFSGCNSRGVIVGYLIGATGSGKTSVVNMLLDKPANFPPARGQGKTAINNITAYKTEETRAVLLKEVPLDDLEATLKANPNEADFAFVLFDGTVSGAFEQVQQAACLCKNASLLTLFIKTKTSALDNETEESVQNFCSANGISIPIPVNTRAGWPEDLFAKVLLACLSSGRTDNGGSSLVYNLGISAVDTILTTGIVYGLTWGVARLFRK